MSEHFLMLSASINQATSNTLTGYLVDLLTNGEAKADNCNQLSGGNVVNSVTMYNTITSMPLEINTHNIGNVNSIANVIFLSGHTRTANRNSTFMFHSVGFDRNANERLEEKNISKSSISLKQNILVFRQLSPVEAP